MNHIAVYILILPFSLAISAHTAAAKGKCDGVSGTHSGTYVVKRLRPSPTYPTEFPEKIEGGWSIAVNPETCEVSGEVNWPLAGEGSTNVIVTGEYGAYGNIEGAFTLKNIFFQAGPDLSFDISFGSDLNATMDQDGNILSEQKSVYQTVYAHNQDYVYRGKFMGN